MCAMRIKFPAPTRVSSSPKVGESQSVDLQAWKNNIILADR